MGPNFKDNESIGLKKWFKVEREVWIFEKFIPFKYYNKFSLFNTEW